MINGTTQVTPVEMGNTYAPINSTETNLASGKAKAQLTVGAAQTVTLEPNTRTIEITPDSILTTPIYIKRGTDSSQAAASATVFDEKICQPKGFLQVGKLYSIKTFSIYCATAGTMVSLIER